jgi:predicted glycosyltransferase
VFAGAAGYNTCCEVIQSGVPSLLVPNTMVADDQARRAELMTRHAPVVVSSCETSEERTAALTRLLTMSAAARRPDLDLDGAERAAEEIMALVVGETAA